MRTLLQYVVDCLQTFDDNNEITQMLSSTVTAPNFAIDSDDLDRELDSLLDDHTSVRYTTLYDCVVTH